MPDEEINVSALLRLKRYEQPPPGYYDKLLQDIHRRQRSELLRRPLWKIAADRVQTFFSEHSMSTMTYAGAMAAVVVCGVAAIGLMMPGTLQRDDRVAVRHEVEPTPGQNLLTLQQSRSFSIGSTDAVQQTAAPAPQPGAHAPRYVIDARPVSYDAPPSL